MPDDFAPDHPQDQPSEPHQHSRRRRRKRRSISEAHAQDRRIKRKVGPPSKLWWLAPIVIGTAGGYVFYTTGFFQTRQDSLSREQQVLATMGGSVTYQNLQKAREFREANLPEKALPLLNQVLDEHPEMGNLAFELAHVHCELGNIEQAREFALLALKRNENIARSNYLIGVTYCLDSQFRDALPYFEAAHKNFDQSAPLLQNWADALRASGQPNLAKEKLERALAQRPGSKILQMKLALTRIDAGESGVVEKEAKRDLRWTPDYIPARLILAAVYLHEDKIDEARVHLDKVRDTVGPMQLKDYLQDVYFIRFRDTESLREYFPSDDERLQMAEESQKQMQAEPEPAAGAPSKPSQPSEPSEPAPGKSPFPAN